MSRRLYLSTSFKAVQVTALHAKFPISGLPRASWLDVCVNVHDVLASCFPGTQLHATEGATLSGSFKVRASVMNCTYFCMNA